MCLPLLISKNTHIRFTNASSKWHGRTIHSNLKCIYFQLCGVLIHGLIYRYLNDNATVDAISDLLRKTCPVLYSVDDATCSKVRKQNL